MKILSDIVTYINNLPSTKKLILLIISVIGLIFIADVVGGMMRSNFKNITNHSIENMDVDVAPSIMQESGPSMSPTPSSNDNSGMLPYMDIMMNTEILNITLYYADWCGHCKKFKTDTWINLKEKFGTSKDVQLN